MTAPPPAPSGAPTPPRWHPATAREALLWPATLGTLCTLALAWAALTVVPPTIARWAAGGAAVAGTLLTAIGCARAATRWAADEARASAAQLAAGVRWRAPGRPDAGTLPPTLRAPLEQAMQLAVAHARAHDAAHAEAGHAALGANVAARLDALAARLAAADVSTHPTAADVRAELASLAAALRTTVTPPPPADAVHDAAHVVVREADAVRAAGAAMTLQHDGATAPVRLHLPSFTAAIAGALRAAAGDAAPAAIAVDVRRARRAAYEEEPVRRADDSPRTIVPRMPQEVVRAWVAATLPPAEVLSVVVADPARTLPPESRAGALTPFGPPRPADPLGLAIAELRRAVERAGGCLWLDDAREGGTAIHFLLPIAAA